MKNKPTLLILLAVLVLVALLGVVQSANASINPSGEFKAWDRNANMFEPNNVDIFWDGGPVAFYSPVRFSRTRYTIQSGDASACGVGSSTRWAGRVVLGLYHTDDDPAGAAGFDHSDSWSIVDCDFDGNGSFGPEDDYVDLAANPPEALAGAEFTVVSSDVVTPCPGPGCQDGILTTAFVNLDADCDGHINLGTNPQRVCFFARGFSPAMNSGPPYWAGPLEARFWSIGGSFSRLGFNPYSPTAITLEQLAALSPGGVHPFVWSTMFVLMAAIAVVLIRESRQQKSRMQ